MAWEFDAPPDGAEELAALLEHSGVDYLQEEMRFRFRFTSQGCAWQTVCDCRGELVLVYGLHPARVEAPERRWHCAPGSMPRSRRGGSSSRKSGLCSALVPGSPSALRPGTALPPPWNTTP